MNWTGEQAPNEVTFEWLEGLVRRYCWGAAMPRQMLVTECVGRQIAQRLRMTARTSYSDPLMLQGPLPEMRFQGIEIVVLMGMKGRMVWFAQGLEPSQEYQGHQEEFEMERLLRQQMELAERERRIRETIMRNTSTIYGGLG